MSVQTVDLLARRIGEYAREHDRAALSVVFHGGEPLLAGPDLIEYAIRSLRAQVPLTTDLRLSVQTNGVLLDEAFLDLFLRYEVKVGVSVDGDREQHDRHRRGPSGQGSYDAVAQALHLLGGSEYRSVYSGLLCTVDLDNDPIRVYEGLLQFAPPEIDLLLPLGNWTHPPPGRSPGDPATPYADWLITVFDLWYGSSRKETDIRLFQSIISLLLGGPSRTEAVGGAPRHFITVETDGSVELSDALKTTAPGMAATGLHLRHSSLTSVLSQLTAGGAEPPATAGRFNLPMLAVPGGRTGELSARCLDCDLVSACGGGLHASRYQAESGFLNPSVYCPDLYRLITHVRDRVTQRLIGSSEVVGAY